MNIIRTAEDFARVLSMPPDSELLTLLRAHSDRLADYPDFAMEDLGMFIVVEPGDHIALIDTALGWSLLDGDSFAKPVELISQHDGWFEVGFVISDDGYFVVIFVPIDARTDKRLLAACKRALIEL